MSTEILINVYVSVSRHGGVVLSTLNGGPWMGAITPIGFLEHLPDREPFIVLFANEIGAEISELRDAIEKAFWVQNHEIVMDFWCGGIGPLSSEPDQITYRRFLQLVHEREAQRATIAAKSKHTAIRRAEFNRVRSDLVLAMIDSGKPYQCTHPGCLVREHLTVDHIVPLSRGGGDDIENLQFMCQPHNSQKGAN